MPPWPGQAPAANLDGLRAIARSCPPTLTGARDKALVLTSFAYASRASEPAGLLLADVQVRPRGLVVDIVAGKTKHSVRSVKVPRSLDPECCPVTAWLSWREQLVAVDARFANPSGLAFHSIDRWGNVGGPMSPDAVTQAVALTPTATRSRLGDAAGPLHHQGVSGAHVRGRRC